MKDLSEHNRKLADAELQKKREDLIPMLGNMKDILKPCPFCGSSAEERAGYDWGKVGCGSWDCLIRNVAFYPHQWNKRRQDHTDSLESRRKIIVPLLRDCDRPAEVSALMNDAALLIEDYERAYVKGEL